MLAVSAKDNGFEAGGVLTAARKQFKSFVCVMQLRLYSRMISE